MSRGESLTPLAKVRGLGASGHGGGHWLEERFSSVALVVLSLWLLFSLLMLPALDYGTVAAWLHGMWGAVPMALFSAAMRASVSPIAIPRASSADRAYAGGTRRSASGRRRKRINIERTCRLGTVAHAHAAASRSARQGARRIEEA